MNNIAIYSLSQFIGDDARHTDRVKSDWLFPHKVKPVNKKKYQKKWRTWPSQTDVFRGKSELFQYVHEKKKSLTVFTRLM